MRVHLACAIGFALLAGCTEGLVASHAPLQSFAAPPAVAMAPQPIPSVPVYTSEEPPWPCEVVGVLDFHTEETSEDKGFDQLKIKANEMGAEAVISAEFEHGEEGEKSHLSGVAIRRKIWDERKYVELGKIDIATPEDADDKGFEAMRQKARAMGADKIVDVRFEHGKEGGTSHLTGTAVKYTSS